MKSLKRALRASLRQCVPAALKAQVPGRVRARLRALLGIEPWPDLAVRHPLFRTSQYRTLRDQARPFDVEKPYKPVLERGHQTAYVLARWFAEARVKTAFHVGYASGRYLFYLSRMGIACGGTDLPAMDTAWVDVPPGILDGATRRRMLRVDFFRLGAEDLQGLWGGCDPLPADVLFSEATFETMLPWRAGAASVARYRTMTSEALRDLMHERFPARLAALRTAVRNMVFIEPEPEAGGAGAVFDACSRRLPELRYSVWGFRPPLDSLFRLSPGNPTRQTVYAFTRDPVLLDALRPYARPL